MYGGLIRFNFLNSIEGIDLVYQLIHYAEQQAETMRKGNINLRDAILNELNFTTSKMQIRAIHTGKEIPSAFPYLKTSYEIPFNTTEVIEWSHINNLEAEIYGAGRAIFTLGFFATDYVVNHEIYKSTSELNINISAIGLAMELADLDNEKTTDGWKFDHGFASYMPNNDLPGVSYYNFIGIIEEVEEMILIPDPEIIGYMTKIKLINHKDSDFFAIEMFINKENVQIENVEKGMSVSGCLWLQGEISS